MEQLQAGDPQQVGDYRLVGRLGSGGMGRVFLGRSPSGRLVAVKVIRPELAAIPDFRARFAREVAAARRVSGFFTAPVVDADPDAAQPWLVTGYVEGPSLAAAVAQGGPMAQAEVVALARGLAEGLAGIHAAGVVHRDLKPSNVLLASDGPRIIDFGISRAAEVASVLTGSGIVVGSPGYMSPEQASGRDVGPASDMFSLGAVLAFAASGSDPFGTGVASALLFRVVHADPSLEGIPPLLLPVVQGCLAKDPAQRPSPADLLTRLADAGEELFAAQPAEAAPLADWHPPTELSAAGRPAGRPSTEAVASKVPGATDDRQHAPATSRRARTRRAWMSAAAALILVGGGVGAALAAHHSGSPPGNSDAHRGLGHRATTSVARRVPVGPEEVVRQFILAINAHRWLRVWQLGGKNLGESFNSMKAGFRLTSYDKVIHMTGSGDLVSARIQAFETTGAVQTYALSYVVQHGVITKGSQTLLQTQGSSSCPHIQYGADGTAGPLFCADGQPNPPVLAYYRAMHLRVLGLGAEATPAEVLHAMCADIRHGSTNPIETDAYYLAQQRNKWSFGTSPPQEVLNGGCS